MAYAPHFRVIARGTLPDGEEFSTGLSLIPGGSTVADALATAYNAFTNWWASGGAHIWNKAYLTSVTAQSIDGSGHVLESETQALAEPLAGSDPQTAPGFCTLALSFETGQKDRRGRPIRGRMFTPNNTQPVIGSYTSGGAAQSIADSGAGLLAYFSDPGDGLVPFEPCVASETQGGRNLLINGTSCDNVWDTMRTRKNQLTPTRYVHSIP